MNNNLVISLTKLINCFLSGYRETEVRKVTKEEIDQLESQMESVFLFCLIWSLACTGDYESREKFNVFLREHIKKIGSKV
jgi:dynein heavy chain